MELRTRSSFLMAVMLVAVFVCIGCSGTHDLTPPAIDLAAVRAVDLAYATGWLSNDPEAVLGLFATDAVISPSGIPAIGGHEAMRAFWWPPGAPTALVTRFDLVQEWAEGSGEMAAVRGTFELSFEYDGKTYSSAGDYNTILTRGDDGQWNIRFRAWNDLPNDAS